MTERYIHWLRAELPALGETAAEARARLADKFPRTALRRMTHLGLLVGSTLDGATLEPEDAMVYASTYAEARALEDYLMSFPQALMSFPQASPSLFQASIHPSGAQQVLIGRQQPISRLWPLAGRARLVEQALLTVLMEPARRVALVGGEEQGSWLTEYNVASTRSFAFAAIVTREAAGSMCRILFTPNAMADDACPSLEEFTRALAGHGPLTWHGAGGLWAIDWS
jgi:hypothetical protein